VYSEEKFHCGFAANSCFTFNACFAASLCGFVSSDNLKIHINALQQVLGDPKLADPQHLPQRRKLVRIVLRHLFDFQEMSR